MGPLDIVLLRGRVAATQQQHHTITLLRVMDPVARAVGQAEFEDSLADRFHITRVAVGEAVDPFQEPASCAQRHLIDAIREAREAGTPWSAIDNCHLIWGNDLTQSPPTQAA